MPFRYFICLAVSSCALLLTACGSNSDSLNPFHIFLSKEMADRYDAYLDLKMNADLMRTEDAEIARMLNEPQFTNVTRTYGQTILKMTNLPLRSEVAKANLVPWSSWWYPQKDNYLFTNTNTNELSTLAKYDLLRKKRAGRSRREQPESAVEYEKNKFNQNSLSWEGLCDAWALAAISQPEPKRPVTMSVGSTSIQFSISDLKALLLLTYAAADESGLKYYGQRFTGHYDGWIYPDILPEQFHRFIEVQLFEKKQAFVMDHDPGPEVWNVPVYKANYSLEAVEGKPDSVFVRTWVYSAESVKTHEKDFVGTRSAVREYDYVLSGHRNTNGDLVVDTGYWVKGPDGIDSRKNHPDYFIEVERPLNIIRKSWNPAIDVTLVDEILARSH